MKATFRVVFFVVVCLLTSIAAPRARADVIQIEYAERPAHSIFMLATTGTVIGYHLVDADDFFSERLTILDDLTHKKELFVITPEATLNGKPLQCTWPPLKPDSSWSWFEETVREDQLCTQLPAPIVIGRTRVLLLYWNRIQQNATPIVQLHDDYPFTDTIRTIP